MGIGVSTFNSKALETPGHAFAFRLAEECQCKGESNAFGWFKKEEIRNVFDIYAASKLLSDTEKSEIQSWIDNLPWDSWNCISFSFDW